MSIKAQDPTPENAAKPAPPHSETAATPAPQFDQAARDARLDSLCTNHVLAALGVGLIPIPIVDVLGVTTVQIDLITKLSAEYQVPMKHDLVKSILASLMGGLFPTAIGGTVVSFLKFIPVLGTAVGTITMPVLSGAATYAVYKVFVQHYETGGTLLDFNPATMKTFFAEQFLAGKLVATDLLKSQDGRKAG